MKSKIIRLLNRVLINIRKPEMKILPGQLAFYIVLTLVPLIMIFAAILPFFNLSSVSLQEVMLFHLPSNVVKFLTDISNSGSLDSSNIVVLITVLFFASNGPHSMIIASNLIYNIENKGYIHRRVKAFVMLVFLIALLVFVLFVPVFGNIIIKILCELFKSERFSSTIYLIYHLAKYPLSFLIIYFLVKLLYVLGPDKKIKSRNVTYGALFTSLAWIVSTAVFSFYVENFASYNTIYGGISSLIVLMLWVYLLAYIYVLGMALNVSKYEVEKRGI